MDRRELLKVLSGGVAGIPAVQSIERLDINPGDTLVLTFPGNLSNEQVLRIKSMMRERFPGQEAMVLCEGATLKVLRNA